jgi:hypothetical protein
MFFIGREKTNLTIRFIPIFLLSLLLIPNFSHADAFQNLPFQIDGSKSEVEKIKLDKDEGESAYVPFTSKENEEYKKTKKKKGSAPFFPDSSQGYLDEKKNLKERTLDFGILPPGSQENRPNYLENDDEKFAQSVLDKGKTGFGFTFIKNNYDFDGKSGVFSKTYDQGEKARRGGTLHFTFDRYFSRGTFDFAWGMNAGLGFSSGRGVFISAQTKSDARVDLWQVPIDAHLTMEINFGNIIKTAFSAGPSIIGLMQVRSDRGDGEAGKRRRQLGKGYFGAAKLKFALGPIFKRNAYSLLKDSSVSRFFLNLEARYQSYDDFNDPVTITGQSYGLGFSFEFL